MIKCEKGNIEIYGMENDLLTELSIIVKRLHEDGKIGKDDLEYAFKLGIMTSEELEEEDKKLDEKIKKNKEELENNLEEFLKNLLGGKLND